MRFTFTVFTLAFLIISGLSATIDDVKAAIKTIAAQTSTLDTLITAFPLTGGTLAQAFAMHNNAVTLGSSIDKGTTVILAKSSPFSDADGAAVLASVKAIVPSIKRALTAVAAKKSAFQALPTAKITAFIKQDFLNLRASATGLENAVIVAAPASVRAEAAALKARIDAAFATAIAAYA